MDPYLEEERAKDDNGAGVKVIHEAANYLKERQWEYGHRIDSARQGWREEG